jgi:hypothetical protein
MQAMKSDTDKNAWCVRHSLRLQDSGLLEEDTFSPEWKEKTRKYRDLLSPLEKGLVKNPRRPTAIVSRDLLDQILNEDVAEVVYYTSDTAVERLGEHFVKVRALYHKYLEEYLDEDDWLRGFGQFCYWLRIEKGVPQVSYFRIAVFVHMLVLGSFAIQETRKKSLSFMQKKLKLT